LEPSCCGDGAASRTTSRIISRYRDGHGCHIVRMVLFGVFGKDKHMNQAGSPICQDASTVVQNLNIDRILWGQFYLQPDCQGSKKA